MQRDRRSDLNGVNMRLQGKGLNLTGQLLLLSATVVWGSSFIILKETIKAVPALYVIGIRFLISAVLLGALFFGKVKRIDKKALKSGVILGLFLSAAYITQTEGLQFIGAGKNAFITSLYCVMCPFMSWIFFGAKPKSYHIISAALCVAGIGIVAISGAEEDGGNVYLGCGLTFICAIFYGLQIIFTSRFHEEKNDTMQLLIIQLFTVGVIISLCSLVFELPQYGINSYALDGDKIWRVIYLTLVCTLYAQLAQIVGLKFTESNQAAVILTLEAVFGVVFAIILGDENITPLLWAGFAVIFVGTFISELKIDVLKPFLRKKVKEVCEVSANDDIET